MTRLPGRHFLRNLIERRALLYQLVRRDFEQRYVGSVAGWLWGFIHPLVMLVCWTFVFQKCLKMEAPNVSDYPLYLLAGYLPWFLFQETLARSSTSLVEQANLITKTVFPSEVVPLAVFCSSLVSHLLTLTLAIVAILLRLDHIGPNLLLLPLYMLLTGLFAVGLGWIFSSLQVYVRDTSQVLTVILTLWFWITPIFITEDKYPENFRFLLRYNPMALLVNFYRDGLLTSQLPRLHDVAILAGCSAATFLIGGLFFRQLKRGFADVL